MRQHFWKPTLLTIAALAMTGLTPALVSAQDRPDDRRPADQRPADQRPDDRRPDNRRPAEQRPADHQVMRADEHRDDHSRDDNRGDDQAQRYRHDHPHSSARCHDGFFTTTKDRNRACTKHGGIDVWLSL